MACPHFAISIRSRAKQSAVAGASYQAAERLYSEYDQSWKDHRSKQKEVIYKEILLPSHAPPEFRDRQTLWNSAESAEKQWNAQLSRGIVMALPRELPADQYADLVREYCMEQFVSRGMCVDVAIHDPPGKDNPHAHIMLTMRALDENGHWLPKARKVYDLDERGDRIVLPSGNYKTHKENTADWNDPGNAERWRTAWADMVNRYFEKNDIDAHLDLRSFERQGNPHAPQIHLGPAVSALERKGVRTNLGNLNRDIRSANRLYDAVRHTVQSLKVWIVEITQKLRDLPEAERSADHNLANILMEYLSVRKEGRADWSISGQMSGQIKDLKQVSELVTFLQQKDIVTIPALGAYLNDLSRQGAELKNRVNAGQRRRRDIDKIFSAADTVKKLAPLWKQYQAIGWKSKKEKFYTANESDLRQYQAAFRFLKKMKVELPLDAQTLNAEKAALEKTDAELLSQLAAVQEELEKLKSVRWCVRQVVPDALPKLGNDGRKSVVEKLHDSPSEKEYRDKHKTHGMER